MAFTNTWDTAFPPDTQLANLLGQDIRNGVKVDVQQRMAAISGLDAAKPNFAGDAQPANWNGILFFATDTGKIYQFNNPAWTDVTSNFTTKSSALKAVNVVNHTGTTTVDNIYTLAMPANILGLTGRARITLWWKVNVIGAGSNGVGVTFGGVDITGGGLSIASGFGTNLMRLVIEGGNTGAANAQRWNGQLFINQQPVTTLMTEFIGAIDTTAGVNIIAQWKNAANTDQQTFDSFTVEFF